MEKHKAELRIVTNSPSDFIPPKYISPGTRLYYGESYYTIIDNMIYGSSFHSIARDNGLYPGMDGSIIQLYIDRLPMIGDIVTIKEGMDLIFV